MIPIICAEHDKHMLDFYEAIFNDKGYKLRICENGNDVIPAYEEEPADAFILDLELPGKSGIDICRELRQGPDTYNIPIVIVTAHDTEENIVQGLTAGADEFIVKPFNPAELLAKLSMVLKKRGDTVTTAVGLPLGSLFLGRYEIARKIGVGRSGQVFYAKDVTVEPPTEVAIKIFDLSPTMYQDQRFMASILREAYGLSRLNDSTIVKLYNFGHTKNHYYLVLEYLDGQTLRQIVERYGAIPENKVIMVAFEMAKALRCLENHNMIHRDITSTNIMATNGGEIKLLDFGLAKQETEKTLSSDGLFKGTPLFASPEAIMSKNVIDIRSDIYSLGAVLYYTITGVPPFSGETQIEICNKHLAEKPRLIRQIVLGVSWEFSNLVDNMLAKDKGDRPSVSELLDILSNIYLEPETDSDTRPRFWLP